MAEQPSTKKQRSFLGSLFRWFKRPRPRYLSQRACRIVPNDDGFELRVLDEPDWSLRWDQVVRLIGYKIDNVATDCVCFNLQLDDTAERVWYIDEETPGFQEIVPQLDHLTNNAFTEKWPSIVQPAFATCWTVVWERPDAEPLPEEYQVIRMISEHPAR